MHFPLFSLHVCGIHPVCPQKSPTGLRMNQRRGGFCCAYYSKFFPLLPHFRLHDTIVSRHPLHMHAFNVWQRPSCFGRCFSFAFLSFLFDNNIGQGIPHIALPITRTLRWFFPSELFRMTLFRTYYFIRETLTGIPRVC